MLFCFLAYFTRYRMCFVFKLLPPGTILKGADRVRVRGRGEAMRQGEGEWGWQGGKGDEKWDARGRGGRDTEGDEGKGGRERRLPPVQPHTQQLTRFKPVRVIALQRNGT